MSKIEIGQVYGRLTVKEQTESKNWSTRWLCICSCGNEKIIKSEYLKNGDTKSCGCLNVEKSTERIKVAHLKRDRCNNTYESLSRGIWEDRYSDGISYEDFMILSQQECYYCKTLHSNKVNRTRVAFIYNGLDRIDSTKNHSMENVRPCCKSCNYAKSDMTEQEFFTMINNIVENEKHQQSVLDKIQERKRDSITNEVCIK